MPLFQQYLFVIGAFQGLLLACLLLVSGRANRANHILGIWCLFLAFGFLGTFISMEGRLNAFSGLIGLSYFLPAAYGPFLYLYCQHALKDREFVRSDIWHSAPLVVSFVLNLDILFASPQVKLDIVLGNLPMSFGLITSEVIQFLQAIVYLALSFILVRRYKQDAADTLSNFNPEIFSWLWKLLALNLIIWVLKAIPKLPGDQAVLSNLGDVLIVVLIYSIAMAQWRNPRLFRIQLLSDEYPLPGDKTAIQNVEVRSTGALDESIRSSLLETLHQHMHDKHTYLDNDLTLARLSAEVGINTHHLSEVLNQQEGKNFYQFVNQYRIDYVCEQMKRDKTAKILDLALNAGFSSKSTFNSVFKKFVGLTPSQYRVKHTSG